MLAILFGPSGAGKSALMSLLEEKPRIQLLRTTTTRPRRGTRELRRTVSDAEYDRLSDLGEITATSPVYGNRYGLERATLEVALRRARPLYLLDFSLENYADTLSLVGHKISFLILPPSPEELTDRLTTQGRSDRVVDAVNEYHHAHNSFETGQLRGRVDHVIINDDLETAGTSIEVLLEDAVARADRADAQQDGEEVDLNRVGFFVDSEIESSLAEGQLLEEGTWLPELVRHASYSVRIGAEAHVYRAGALQDDGRRACEVVRFGADQYVELSPGDTALVFSLEHFRLPADVLGFVYPRGLFIASGMIMGASYLDPGFSGRYCFPITNVSSRIIRLPHGLEVARAQFFGLGRAVDRPYSSADATSLQTELDSFVSFTARTSEQSRRSTTGALVADVSRGNIAGAEIAELFRRIRLQTLLAVVGLMVWGVLLVVVNGDAIASWLGGVSAWGTFLLNVFAGVIAAGVVTLLAVVSRRRTEHKSAQ